MNDYKRHQHVTLQYKPDGDYTHMATRTIEYRGDQEIGNRLIKWKEEGNKLNDERFARFGPSLITSGTVCYWAEVEV